MMRAAMFPHLAANSGFSTMSLPRLLDNSANKSLQQAYREYPASWRTISAVRSANNFKEHRSLRAVLNGTLDSVGNGGEIKHADMDEEAYGFQVLTFAKMLAITRTNIVNDDLSAFSQVPAALGRMAARSLSDLVWKTVLLNTTYDLQTFWQSTNGNIINSPGGELSFDSLSAAIILMRNQQDADGMSLDIRPQTLVVPPALEMTARQLLRSAENQRDVSVDNQGTRNPIADLVANLEVEPRLSNTEFSGASAKKWFLFSSPVNASILVAFLDGRSTPTIESSETDFNTLGMQWRVYHDYGCALGDTRASVMSTGDAA